MTNSTEAAEPAKKIRCSCWTGDWEKVNANQAVEECPRCHGFKPIYEAPEGPFNAPRFKRVKVSSK